jgi:alkylated DNA repair dioxygenase AlkB
MDLLFPQMAPPQQLLPPGLPVGFRYWPDFLSEEEEGELLAGFATLEFKAAVYHEYTAQRRTIGFGLGMRFGGTVAAPTHELQQRPPAPEFLRRLAAKVARHVGRDPADFPNALVTEYQPGAPIGWHRDAPPFAAIYGVSLGSDCTFCLRPYIPETPSSAGAAKRPRRNDTVKLTAERRSLYVMAGAARSAWQHSIPPVKTLRYSVTLRTLH